MTADTPFIDPDSGVLDTKQVLFEALPIAKLIGLFVAVALLPTATAFFLSPLGPLGGLLLIVSQFVLAVGAAIVLLYVIVRGQQLAEA